MSDEEQHQEGLTAEEQAMMEADRQTDEVEAAVAESESEPQPEAAAAAEPEKKPTSVPLPELLEERRARQAAERQLATLSQRMDTILHKIQEAGQETPAGPPDRAEDPAGYLQWQNEQILRNQEADNQRRQTEAEEHQRTIAAQNFVNDYNTKVQEFAATVPDYTQATEFLVNTRRQELAAMGITDPGMQEQILWQDSFSVAQYAKQMGRNHAEIFYNLAKQRGYNPQAVGQQKPAGQTPGIPATIKQGMKATSPMSGGSPGGTGEGELTTEALLSMTDEEFAQATRGTNWKKLHGLR